MDIFTLMIWETEFLIWWAIGYSHFTLYKNLLFSQYSDIYDDALVSVLHSKTSVNIFEISTYPYNIKNIKPGDPTSSKTSSFQNMCVYTVIIRILCTLVK